MKDYEQLYYDELYKNRKLIKKNKELEEEIIVLKNLLKKMKDKIMNQLLNEIFK